MDLIGQRILIIEDDPSLGKALQEFLARDFHNVSVARNSFEAFALLSQEPFNLILVDWHLSGMNGLDIVNQYRQKYPKQKTKILLMSGLYTTPELIKEAKRRARTDVFLVKPFGLEELKAHVPPPISIEEFRKSKEIKVHPRKTLYQLFSDEKITKRKQRKAIEALDEIWDYDLPFVLSLLVASESSGNLMIYHDNGAISSVSFSGGAIIQVDTDGQLAFFKNLLKSSDYLLAPREFSYDGESLRAYGAMYIENNLLSPHSLTEVLYEQMNISLSKLIRSEKVKINFVDQELEIKEPSISSEELFPFLQDWIVTKIPGPWLKVQFKAWSNNKLKPGSQYSEEHPIFSTAVGSFLTNFSSYLAEEKTVKEILQLGIYPEEMFYKFLLLALTTKVVMFSTEVKAVSDAEQLEELRSIQSDFHGRSPYDIYQIIQSQVMNSSLPEEVVQEYIEFLGPEPLPQKRELFILWNRLHDIIEGTVKVAKDKEKMQAFQSQKKRQQENLLREIESNMVKAKELLVARKYYEAQKIVDDVESKNPATYQLHSLRIWSLLGQLTLITRKDIFSKIDLELTQIPPDERYDIIYLFVLAWLKSEKGDVVEGTKALKKVLEKDPQFKPALERLHPEMKHSAPVASPAASPVSSNMPTTFPAPPRETKPDLSEKSLVDYFSKIFKRSS